MRTIEETFWTKVEKSEDGHWYWRGGKTEEGHGRIYVYIEPGKRKNTTAPRVSWQIHNGPIPPKVMVCHKCGITDCVNPEHLYLCTHNFQPIDA